MNRIKYSANRVTVWTEDGSKYAAKYAIVTVSLGVLQSDLIKFEPAWPVTASLPPSTIAHTAASVCRVSTRLAWHGMAWPTDHGECASRTGSWTCCASTTWRSTPTSSSSSRTSSGPTRSSFCTRTGEEGTTPSGRSVSNLELASSPVQSVTCPVHS